MGKKRRQQFQSMSMAITKDEEGLKSCEHIVKGVNLNRVKPKRNQKLQQKRLAVLDSTAAKQQETLWICLKCMQLDCGHNQHTYSGVAGSHHISLNLITKKAWCNVCKINIAPKDNHKINKAVQYLQHVEDIYKYDVTKTEEKTKPEEDSEELDFRGFPDTNDESCVESCSDSGIKIPRGLKNLGNTCFFNVILQCLARTPNFVSQLERLKEQRNDTCKLSILMDDPEKSMEVSLSMEKWMNFSDILLKSLTELCMPSTEPYVPDKLLNELYRVSNAIEKQEQNDAHELLREVLQKINEVDPERYKSAVQKKVKCTITINKERINVPIHVIKSCENQITKEPILERIFGGTLVSILKCQECGNTSCISEPFLDLSLPINEKNITSNQKKEHDSQQQRKYKTTMNKHALKINETEHSEADVVDSFEQDSRNSWTEESGYEEESCENPLKSHLSTGRPVPTIADDEKVLNSSPAVFTEISMSSEAGADSKDEGHKDCIQNLICYSVDTTLDTSAERIISAVEVENKDSEHKWCRKNLTMSSPCPSDSKNVGVSPATPEDKSENIMITAAAETNYQKPECDMKYLAVSSPCSETADTMTSKHLGCSDCIMNAVIGDESQDMGHENLEKNLGVCCESTASPLLDRDTPSPVFVSSETNIDCSVSIHRHTSCSSSVLPDCSRYRPVSQYAIYDNVTGVARSISVNEIDSISLNAAMDELSLTFSNHTLSPAKLITANESSCNDAEFLDCHGESGSLSLAINEYSEVNLNQKRIIEGVRKLNLNSDDNLGSCIPPNYTNAKGNSAPEMKQRNKDKNDTGSSENKDHGTRFTIMCCLENFTALELLTDCEKVACSRCTEKKGKGEMVFSASTKQMQIRTAPAVLILHLKRFQIKAGRSSKTSKVIKLTKLHKHIEFPFVLDLSPYIYSENKEVNLTTQKENTYSLYAVIEHKGSINSGHYIVYMKIKPTSVSHLKDVNENEYVKDEEIPLPNEWFSISDEVVKKVDEDMVLNSQAYILFYEKC